MAITMLAKLAILASLNSILVQLMDAHLLAQFSLVILAPGLVQHLQALVLVLMDLQLSAVMVSEQEPKHAMMQILLQEMVAPLPAQLRLDILALEVAHLLLILAQLFAEIANK